MDEGRSNGPVVETARTGGQCGSCGSKNVMTVGMLIEDGPISVRMCSDCESRTWIRDGTPLDLDQLLHAFRNTTRRS
jgi:hypothetical protein